MLENPRYTLRFAIALFVLFGQGALIVAAQLFAPILLLASRKWYFQYIRKTEEAWGLLMIWLNEYFAPQTKMWVTIDKDMGDIEDMVQRDTQGNVTSLKMLPRAIVIANHQTYGDWLYIWCVAYLADMHGAMKIILKDSLKWLPIFGWGMQFFDFIFLTRKWAKDQAIMRENLTRTTKHPDQPLWLLLFPEGTVVSEKTLERSNEYAKLNKYSPTTNCLLPRSTGMHFCVETLRSSVDYIYDFTVGYEGVLPGQIPETVYTLRKIYFEEQPPRGVHIHMRRYNIQDLPTDEKEFGEWLRGVWAEKDALMTEFYTRGRFPSGGVLGLEKEQKGGLKEDGRIQLPIRLNSLLDLTQIWFYLIPYAVAWHFLRTWNTGESVWNAGENMPNLLTAYENMPNFFAGFI